MSEVFDQWYVNVGGQSYGPYTHAMMARFVGEGRVTSTSEITADPSAGWYSAARYPQFAQWTVEGHGAAAQSDKPSVSSRPVTRHLVMAELRSGGSLDLLRAMQGYMQCTRIGDTVWLVDGAGDTDALTRTLSRSVSAGDRLFIVDITSSETGQFGFLDAAKSA